MMIQFDPTTGWATSIYTGNPGSTFMARANALDVTLATEPVTVPETTDPETGETVPEHTVDMAVDWRRYQLVDGQPVLKTQAERDAYDAQCVIDAIPAAVKAEANNLLSLMTRIVTESAEAGVTLDISASNTTAELIDVIDKSDLSMTRKSYYASLLLSRWKRYHEECGGTWEQLKMGPFA